ncbi:nuclear transport factor 2 family protein [Streptococcus merionis]
MTEQILKELFAQVNTAMVQKDTASLEAILTDDMTLTHMTGYVQPKVEWLEDIASEEMRYYSSTNEATYDIVIDGDRASLTSHDLVEASIWGSARNTW